MSSGRPDSGYVDPKGDAITEWIPAFFGSHYTTIGEGIRCSAEL